MTHHFPDVHPNVHVDARPFVATCPTILNEGVQRPNK
jgi:hypothetical protein